jgi:hypothetical protein
MMANLQVEPMQTASDGRWRELNFLVRLLGRLGVRVRLRAAGYWCVNHHRKHHQRLEIDGLRVKVSCVRCGRRFIR